MPALTVNGSRMNYEEVGSGAPLVFLGYTRFDSAKGWVPYMAEHAKGFRVILPDPRGLGGSAHTTRVKPSDWVEDLAGLLDALSLRSVHLCAETLGSRVATRFAADHPDRVNTLILNGAIAYSSPEGDAERRRTAAVASMPKDRQETMRRSHGADWQAVNKFYQDFHARDDFKRYYDLRRVAKRVRAPTLIVRGDIDEPVHPVSHSAVLHQRIPGSWLAIYPNAPFNAMRARPQEAWSLIRTFIAAAKAKQASAG